MFVYLTTNAVNSKQYVGQTKSKRKQYLGSGILLNNAIDKYGRENFKRQVLIRCSSQEELNEQEIFWINKLNTLYPNGYNLMDGGYGFTRHSEEYKRRLSKERLGENNPFYGRKHTEKTKQRISKLGKGRKLGELSEETKRKIGEASKGRVPWNKGKKHSEETKRKMKEAHRNKDYSGTNNPFYGKRHSEETKEKFSIIHSGRKHTEESKKKMSEERTKYWQARKKATSS